MRTWVKWSGFAAAAMVATSAFAADHTDGPGVTAESASDINDVYGWLNAAGDGLVMIQTIGGVSGSDFSTSTQYVFHIGRAAADTDVLLAPAASQSTLLCTFETLTSIECWLDNGSGAAPEYATGDPTGAAGIMSQNGAFQVHAAPHADPFFFYLTGLNNARDFVRVALTNTLLTFDGNGCPDNMATVLNAGGCIGETFSSVLLGVLNGSFVDSTDCSAVAGMFQVNNFDTLNSSALVVEVDKAAIGDGMTGEYFTVWASTNMDTN